MTRTLRRGHRGPDVLRWPHFLFERGFAPGALDGVFGELTVAATVRTFDTGPRNRGVKESNLGVLRDDLLGNTPGHHPCVACLLEVESLDVSAVDELFNTGPQAELVRTRVAAAIAAASLKWPTERPSLRDQIPPT